MELLTLTAFNCAAMWLPCAIMLHCPPDQLATSRPISLAGLKAWRADWASSTKGCCTGRPSPSLISSRYCGRGVMWNSLVKSTPSGSCRRWSRDVKPLPGFLLPHQCLTCGPEQVSEQMCVCCIVPAVVTQLTTKTSLSSYRWGCQWRVGGTFHSSSQPFSNSFSQSSVGMAIHMYHLLALRR